MNTRRLRSASLTFCILLSPVFSNAETTKQEPAKTNPQAQIIEVAGKVEFKASISDKIASQNVSAMSAADPQKITIHKPGASFIKIHFANFAIPEGSEVIIRDSKNMQEHRYGTQHDTPFTVDATAGDDGVKSFSALSIIGDTAIVEYLTNGNDTLPYTVDIDYIMEGYPEEEIELIALQSTQGLVGPLSTCGVNERRDVQCWADSHPTEFERSRPVARLLINGSGLCTAWRVGSDNRMFTNNHCVASQSELSNTEVWFNYQRSGCGSGSTTSTSIVTGNTLLATDYTLDYTLFSVNNFNSITSFGHFGLDVRDAVSQEVIYIPQHGSGNPKELAIESDQNSGGLCRVDDPFINGRGSNTDIGYYCDTIGGSSGSPVLAKSSNNVIALHHFGGCLNQGVRIAQIWPQVASIFNNQIPVGDNGGDNPPPPPPSETELLNGIPVSGLSGAQGSERFYVMNVPAGSGNVEISINGGSGDADLYVRVGSRPTTSSYDCRPYRNGNSESCSLAAGTSGEVFVMLQGYRAYSGVTLQGSYQESGGGSSPNSGSENNLSGNQGDWQHFSVEVPPGSNSLNIDISGGSGDADLYVRRGQQPTTSSYDCRPYRNGNNESCSFTSPQAGIWYMSLRGYSSYSAVGLNWQYQ